MCIHHRFFRLFSFGCILGSPVLGLSQNSTNVVLSTGTNQAISVSTSSRPGVAIRPSARTYGYSTPEMFLRAVRNPTVFPIKDSTLQLENLVGNIDIILPRRDAPPAGLGVFATPPTAGVFSISKRIDNGTDVLGQLVPILQIQPSSTGPDALTVRGNFQLLDERSGVITTLIDSAGIDTASVVTDSLVIHDLVTGLPVNLTVADGVLSLEAVVQPSSVGAPIVRGDRAVVMGGMNNQGTGWGSIVLGGMNFSDQSNIAAGVASSIIGAKASTVNATLSAIIGGQGSQILNPESAYSAIIGGGGNVMSGAAGGYNVILGGYSNQFVSGGSASGIIGGGGNQIVQGSYHQAILAGEGTLIGHSRGSVILGGYQSRIVGNVSSGVGQNLIGGGEFNEVGANAYRGAILGGSGNIISAGWNNAIIGALNATNAGSASLVTGEGTVSVGRAQFVSGQFNAAVSEAAFIIGNGSNGSARSNALVIDFHGNVEAAGAVKAKAVLLTAPQGNISMGAFTDD